LLASVITGWLWGAFSSSIAFYTTAFAALVVLIYFLLFHRPGKAEA
jgi:hypothetical protein